MTEDIAGLYQAIWNAPVDIALSNYRANEILERRTRILGQYCREGIPSDIKEKFEESVKITLKCAEVAGNSIVIADNVLVLVNYSDTELLIFAGKYYDAIQQHFNEDPVITADLRKLRERAVVILSLYFQGPKDKPDLSLFFDAHLTDMSFDDSTTTKFEAGMMVTQINNWKQSFQTYSLMAQICLLFRSMLYEALLGGLGSKLERQVSIENIKKDASKLPEAALSLIPGFGEIFSKMKLLTDFAFHLFAKEENIRLDADDLIIKNQRLTEFVDFYNKVLLLWASSTLSAQNSLISVIATVHDQLAGKLGADSPSPTDAAPLSGSTG